MNLLLEPIDGGHFLLLEGNMEDFLKIKEWADFYRDHTTKKPLSIEDMNFLVPVVEKLIHGVEHGIYSVENWQADLLLLYEFLAERGYELKTQP